MAKTRLTKDIREQLVVAIIKATDLYKQRDELMQRVRDEARRQALASLPEGFLGAIAGMPKEWVRQQSTIYPPHDESPVSVLEPGTYGGRGVDLDPPIPVPANEGTLYCKMPELMQEALAWKDTVSQLEASTRAYLMQFRYIEDAVEKMPELKPLLPKKLAPSYPLAAPSNLLTELLAAGFKVAA